MKIQILLTLIACSLFYTAVSQVNILKIEGGLISGLKNASGDISIYKGIPFAAPPVGDLRWKAPQPVIPWNGVRACTTFGASPMQGKPVPFMVYTSEFLIPESPISEDCLYLNVWTIARSSQEKRPVLVWIYGGGFVSGGAAVPIYDGEALAKKGIVVVSINYRVGVFGFFAHPELSAENEHHVSGNYGLLDQIAALEWVKKNIHVFGGDPSNVTIAGQSAGSMSVNSLIISPLTKGLFHKAIGESGSHMASRALGMAGELKAREEAGKKLTESIGMSLPQLRQMPADTVVKKLNGRFNPVIDGYVIPAAHASLYAKGNYHQVPLLTGWNADERFSNIKPMAEFKTEMEALYGKDSETIFKLYPANTEEQSVKAQQDFGRDASFGISTYAWARLHASGKSKVFVYNFTRKPPAEGVYVQYGAFHTAEVPYFFNTLKYFNRPLQPIDHALAGLMSSFWVNFMKNGDPNGPGLPQWPSFNEPTGMVMILNQNAIATPLPRKDRMEFLFEKLK